MFAGDCRPLGLGVKRLKWYGLSYPHPRVEEVAVSTALYRRYRPETFAEVIGQEHVTEPLMVALEKNRVNHAYLFSGPRG